LFDILVYLWDLYGFREMWHIYCIILFCGVSRMNGYVRPRIK